MTDPTAFEEKKLLCHLKDGDSAAFETLYKLYSKQFYWKLLKMTKDSNQADEILQELFIKVWERRDHINPEQSFGAFLYRTAQRMVVDHYRRIAMVSRMHEQIQNSTTEIVSPTEEDYSSKETEELLGKAIETLSPQRKQAFTLCRIDGKSYKEVADIMSVSTNTVRNHLVSATKQIKDYLEQSHKTEALLGLMALICKL